MGSTFANDLADMKDLSIGNAIGIHLSSNHYPPVPLSMVQPCIDAIDAIWEGDYHALIAMPEGVTYKGEDSAPAWAIVEAHHLEAWLPEEEY